MIGRAPGIPRLQAGEDVNDTLATGSTGIPYVP